MINNLSDSWSNRWLFAGTLLLVLEISSRKLLSKNPPSGTNSSTLAIASCFGEGPLADGLLFDWFVGFVDVVTEEDVDLDETNEALEVGIGMPPPIGPIGWNVNNNM